MFKQRVRNRNCGGYIKGKVISYFRVQQVEDVPAEKNKYIKVNAKNTR